jgi:glutamate-1-semialdehyde 2,1-aminomutase
LEFEDTMTSSAKPFPGKSRTARLARARQHMPMGVAENYRYWGEDETIFVESMKGGTITDFDGNTFVDFRLGYGPIILGYRDPRVDAAVVKTITERGTVCGFSSDIEVEVVETLKSMCPNIDKLRFANSGTEAVMAAVRVARGYTGRDRIIQVEGGFHGLYDEMMWKSDLEGWDADQGGDPDVIPFGVGIPAASRALSEFVPLNDVDALDAAFDRLGDDVAAVVLEPIQGNAGSIASTDAYMAHLRAKCTERGAVLIMDEVKTGFRVARGGVQELYGVHGDLTTYAKAMGNGYPVAAFGGRADIMDTINMDGGVVHGGTYTANLIGLSAASATLKILAETDALETVNRVGEAIQGVLGGVLDRFDLEHRFAGPPSMFGVHLGDHVPQNYRDWKQTWSTLYEAFAKNLIRNGLMLEPDSREPWFICEAHRDVDLGWIDEVATKSMKDALDSGVR